MRVNRTFDALGQVLTETVMHAANDPAPAYKAFSYDAAGRIASWEIDARAQELIRATRLTSSNCAGQALGPAYRGREAGVPRPIHHHLRVRRGQQPARENRKQPGHYVRIRPRQPQHAVHFPLSTPSRSMRAAPSPPPLACAPSPRSATTPPATRSASSRGRYRDPVSLRCRQPQIAAIDHGERLHRIRLRLRWQPHADAALLQSGREPRGA